MGNTFMVGGFVQWSMVLIMVVFRANQGVSYSKRTTVCWNDRAVSRCKGAALWRRRSGARDIKAARLVCILRVAVTFIESRLRSTIPSRIVRAMNRTSWPCNHCSYGGSGRPNRDPEAASSQEGEKQLEQLTRQGTANQRV
ncbi:hypothetical protein J6590_080952 [Homalodisca vitripennis]|nr:hypothetical protein J6590_080952 [Homalodisca vitripennis]